MDICGFSKTYNDRTVLSFPDFSFREGRIYAVIGANGCGKSTLAKILSGTLPPDDRKKNIIPPEISIGYLPQKPYAFHLSLLQNIMVNSAGKNAAASKQEADHTVDHARQLMERLSLTHLAHKKAVSLSGGETARMCLARLLMKDYSLLILDEPCAAMDISSTPAAEALIKDYCQRTNSVVILITHSISQALRVADEVLFFSEGKLIEAGASKQLLKHPKEKKTVEYLNFYGGD